MASALVYTIFFFSGGFFSKLLTNASIGIGCLTGKSTLAAERRFKQCMNGVHKEMCGKCMY
jgi:hypothetical protein